MDPTQHLIHFEGQHLERWQLGGNGGVFLLCPIDSLLAHDRKDQGERYMQPFLDHERSKTELKALMPEDAKEAIGHGVRAKRSKSGAVSFDLLEAGGSSHAAL